MPRLIVLLLLLFAPLTDLRAEDSPTEPIAKEREVFVAVGYGGRRMISGDGKAWEITAEWIQPGGDDKYNLMGLVFAEGKFVAVGGGGGGRTGAGHILVSTDGRKWRSVHSATNRINPIVYGNGQFLVGGPKRHLLTSPDGETWTERAQIESKNATHFRRGAFGNGVFVVLGNHGGSGGPFWCAVTKDGTEITSYREDMPTNRGIAFGNGRFVIVGHDGVRRSSVDGKTWEVHDGPETDNYNWVIWTGSEFLTASGRTTYSSTDGRTWKIDERVLRHHVKWSNGKRFISTGWPGKMFHSTDGTAWTQAPPMTKNGINAVVRGVVAP